jgi:ABC-2 type transport system ATP-binding protein
MEHVLEVRGLVHRYGDHTALAGVDLTVKSGECVALLGPNGAGKTTLVRNVIGLIEGNANIIEVAGGNPRNAETRRRLGVVQQAVGFPRSLTVGEIVSGAAVRRGFPRKQPAEP